MDRPKRVLIDWDWAAHGIWSIAGRDRASASVTDEEGHNAPGCVLARPWGDVLSAELLDALQDWNNAADQFYGPRASPARPGDAAIEAFWARGSRLAERVQEELGPDWEVLFNPGPGPGRGSWVWTWVRSPSNWDQAHTPGVRRPPGIPPSRRP